MNIAASCRLERKDTRLGWRGVMPELLTREPNRAKLRHCGEMSGAILSWLKLYRRVGQLRGRTA